jgi:hypothetical protein
MVSLPRMKEFYSRIRPIARKYGMELQPAKCKGLWLSGAPMPKALAEWTNEIGLRIETRASVLLGSPVGRYPAAIEACLRDNYKAHDSLFKQHSSSVGSAECPKSTITYDPCTPAS